MVSSGSRMRAHPARGAVHSAATPFTTVSAVIGVCLIFLVFYPVVRVVSGLFYRQGRLTLEPIIHTVTQPEFLSTVLDTSIVVASSAVIALFVGGALAWLNTRTNARMGLVTDVLPIVNFLLPSIAAAIGWMFLLSPVAGYVNFFLRLVLGVFGLHLESGPLVANSWYTVIGVYAVNMVPLSFLLLSAGFTGMDPSLEEQSAVSGAGRLTTMLRVTFPMLRPSILGALFLMIWYGLAMFSVPFILADPAGINIVSVKVVQALRFAFPPDTDLAVGYGVLVMIVLGAIWWLQRRALRTGLYGTVGGKGYRATRIDLGRGKWVARAVMILYLMIAVLLPLAALLIVSLNGFWTLDINWAHLNLDAIAEIFIGTQTRIPLQNSLLLATISATVAVIVAALVSLWINSSKNPLARISGAAMKLPAAVSTLVLAIGFVLAFGGTPFFLGGTLLILFLAYMAISMPEASVTADTALGMVGKELAEASSVSGAGVARTFFRIYLPLMIPGLLAGWALIFVRIMGDLEASSILADATNGVVGFQILNFFEEGQTAQLAALALVLTVISAVVIALVMVISWRLSKWTSTSPQGPHRTGGLPGQLPTAQ